MMSFENIYQQDPTKKKTLYISSSTISINGSLTRMSSPGNTVGPISSGDPISVSVAFYPIDPYANDTNTTVSITDSEYTYSVSASIISKTFNGIIDGLTETLVVNNTWTNNGQTFNQYTYTMTGTASNIVYSSYNVIMRFTITCTDSDGNVVRADSTDQSINFTTDIDSDNQYYWDSTWLSSLPQIEFFAGGTAYVIFSGGLGSYIDVGVRLQNQPNQEVAYTFVPPKNDYDYMPHNSTRFVPDGVSILSGGIFGGSISLNSAVKTYFFSIGAAVNNKGTTVYGSPDTRSTIFCIVVENYVSSEISQFNQITWKTAAGNLGTVYEGYPSYFNISATTSTGGTVSYGLAPYSASLPPGINLNSDGTITGNFPYVASLTNYYFTIRAQNGLFYTDRNFNIIVQQLYGSSTFFNLHIPVFNDIKKLITNLTNNISESDIYRYYDENFGLVTNHMVYMVAGLTMNNDIVGYWDNTLPSTSPLYGVGQDKSVITYKNQENYYSCLIDKLRNYHYPFEITISGLSSSPYYSYDGQHVCDVIYINVSDYHDENGCFSSTGVEKLITYDVIDSYEIDDMNIPSNNNGRVCISSITNCRYDLIETTNRVTSPTYMIRPKAKPGIGLVGSEGMPMWMMKTPSTNLGFVPAIEIAYVTAGTGVTIVNNLKTTSDYMNIIGQSWRVDRYVVETKTTSGLHFDLLNTTTSSGKTVTTETLFDDGTTLFDVSYEPSYKYLFFPKLGDI